MNVGMSTACFFGRLLNEEALREIGDMGIHLAEVFFAGQCEYRPSFVHELRRIAREKDIHIRSVHAFTTQFEPQLFSIHPRQFQEAKETLYQVLDAAAALGADTYVFHGPPYLKRARKLEVDYPRVGQTMSEIADLAAEYGVRLCYETVHWCWYHFPDFAPRLLEHVSSDNLFFTLDMKQAAQSGYEMTEYIDKMDGRLAHVHVCDFAVDPERGTVPRMPMQGQADWSGLRDKLREVDFKGDLMLEVYTRDYDTREQLMDSYEAVRSYFA